MLLELEAELEDTEVKEYSDAEISTFLKQLEGEDSDDSEMSGGSTEYEGNAKNSGGLEWQKSAAKVVAVKDGQGKVTLLMATDELKAELEGSPAAPPSGGVKFHASPTELTKTLRTEEMVFGGSSDDSWSGEVEDDWGHDWGPKECSRRRRQDFLLTGAQLMTVTDSVISQSQPPFE